MKFQMIFRKVKPLLRRCVELSRPADTLRRYVFFLALAADLCLVFHQVTTPAIPSATRTTPKTSMIKEPASNTIGPLHR